MQHAQRALTQKPEPDAAPRTIIINFLRFDVNKAVMQRAWKKKVGKGLQVATVREDPGSSMAGENTEGVSMATSRRQGMEEVEWKRMDLNE